MILLLLACGAPGDESGVVEDEVPTVADATCDREPALDWDNFGHAFFTRYCTSCHSANLAGSDRTGAPPGVDFDSEAQARKWAGVLEGTVISEEASMPPGGGPTNDELTLLAEWIACS